MLWPMIIAMVLPVCKAVRFAHVCFASPFTSGDTKAAEAWHGESGGEEADAGGVLCSSGL